MYLAMEHTTNNKIGILFFSPTSTTKKICNAIASGMGSDNPLILDITHPDTRSEIIANANTVLDKIDHLIAGAPVYCGKLPLQAIECLEALKGKGKKATVVAVYGNRDYGIALHNMAEILSHNGFTIMAAGLFIGQHSYSDVVPVAVGRPDESDIEKAREFGAQIIQASRPLNMEDIPIQWDKHSKSKEYTALKPTYKEKICVKCGRCADVCPTGILSSETGTHINRYVKNNCIGCMACVRNCESEARITKANPIVRIMMKSVLEKASRERKEPFVMM
jgi:ferredoxin